MVPRFFAVALSAAMLASAGCLTASVDDALTPEAAATPAPLPAIAATGVGAVGFIADFIMTHPFRENGHRAEQQAARDDLVAELESFGLPVTLEPYSASADGINMLATLEGTRLPHEWIVLSAHYDTVGQTVYGAWDDGAGTAMLMELARALADTPLERTVVFAFFDGEEKGLLGSQAFVARHLEDATLVANLNFDPPGLNWPCADVQGPLPVKIILNAEKTEDGVAGYPEMAAAVVAALDAAGVPDDVRDFDSGIPIATVDGRGPKGGSDHMSFDKVDVPNVFIGSAPTTTVGPAAVLTYALHSPIDTLEQMVARCGGEDLLEQAFQVEIDIAIGTLLALASA